MNQSQRSRLVVGILLILFGAWFLAVRLVPGLERLLPTQMAWPMIVVGVGAFLLVFGLLVGTPEMAIPACIVGGIGGILYWQNATGNWGSWAYLWTLIPGFSGAGMIIASLLGGRGENSVRHGLDTILSSLILFLIFATLMTGTRWLGIYTPLVLIGVGVIMLVRSLLSRHQ